MELLSSSAVLVYAALAVWAREPRASGRWLFACLASTALWLAVRNQFPAAGCVAAAGLAMWGWNARGRGKIAAHTSTSADRPSISHEPLLTCFACGLLAFLVINTLNVAIRDEALQARRVMSGESPASNGTRATPPTFLENLNPGKTTNARIPGSVIAAGAMLCALLLAAVLQPVPSEFRS